MTRGPMLFEKSPFPFGGVERWMPPSHPNTPDAPNMNMLVTVGENTARECGITREESDELVVLLARPGRGRDQGRPLRRRDRSRDGARRTRRDRDGEPWTSTRGRHDAREAGGVAGAVGPARRDRDRRELVGHRRRRRRRRGDVAGLRARRMGWRRWRRCGRGTTPGSSRPAPGWRRRSACLGRWRRPGLTESDVDLVEINEAFATMAVACSRKLGFPHDIVNVNGGAVGLGHPIAASGTRIPGDPDPRAAPARWRHRRRHALRRGRHGLGHGGGGPPGGR